MTYVAKAEDGLHSQHSEQPTREGRQLHRDVHGRLYSTRDEFLVSPNSYRSGLCPCQIRELECGGPWSLRSRTGLLSKT